MLHFIIPLSVGVDSGTVVVIGGCGGGGDGGFSVSVTQKNRIYNRSPMQTEKSQPLGQRIMPETKFTEFSALSVDPRVGISRSAWETD